MKKKKMEDIFEEEETKKLRKEQEIFSNLFKNCLFWISREVPRESLEFVIKSFGGKCTWEEAGKMKVDDKRITHHVIDRDKILGKKNNHVRIYSTAIYFRLCK